MSHRAFNEQRLLEKIRRLPPDKIKEIEEFVNFLERGENDDENAFMRAVVQGLADIEAGRSVSLAEAKQRLGPT